MDGINWLSILAVISGVVALATFIVAGLSALIYSRPRLLQNEEDIRALKKQNQDQATQIAMLERLLLSPAAITELAATTARVNERIIQMLASLEARVTAEHAAILVALQELSRDRQQ